MSMRVIPENHCPRLIEIQDMMSFFNEEKTSFRLAVSGMGNNYGIDLGTVLTSILKLGVHIQSEQFSFQNLTVRKTPEEREQILFYDLVKLVINR